MNKVFFSVRFVFGFDSTINLCVKGWILLISNGKTIDCYIQN